jgi:CheY-like chemotaxis protein
VTADRLHVLLAEDDEGHAILVRRNLRRAGLPNDPVHLRDGQELLDYLSFRPPWTNRPPHEALAVILDLNMPRLSGSEVLERFRGHATLMRLPVFVLSTTDNEAELDRCYALGASACLVKPIDYASFGTMVQRLGELLLAASLPGEIPAGRRNP